MKLLLVGRNGQFLPVDALLYINDSLRLLAVVRGGIHGLLHREEVTASVLCHDKVIFHHMVRQGRNRLHNGRQQEFHQFPGSCRIGVGIVHKTVRMPRIHSLRNPHVITS